MRSLVLLICLLLVAAVGASPVPGDPLSPFTLQTPKGVPWHWSPGRTTVFTFCAFWCDTWKTQLPRAAASARSVNGLPVDFVTISVDGRWSDKAAKRPDVILNDPASALTRKLGIDRIPYTLVVAPSGLITWAGAGTQRSEELIRAIRSSPSMKTARKTAYLTFDDFPAPHLSFELLDELRALDAPATFFCICRHLQDNPAIADQLRRQGFHPQIHAWDHDRDHPEIDRCVRTLTAMGFPPPRLSRLPGAEKISLLTGIPVPHPVDDPYDYTHPGSPEIARRVLLSVRDGSVIQLHAGVQDTLDALPAIIKNLRERGFELRKLDDEQGPVNVPGPR